jgi:hypothetical protein
MIIGSRKLKYSQKNLSLCQFIHHKSKCSTVVLLTLGVLGNKPTTHRLIAVSVPSDLYVVRTTTNVHNAVKVCWSCYILYAFRLCLVLARICLTNEVNAALVPWAHPSFRIIIVCSGSKVKVKQSHYRTRQPYAPAAFTAQEIFLVLIHTQCDRKDCVNE